MLKLCGAALILCAPALFALFRYGNYLRQDRLLAAFLDTLTLSSERIRSDLTALPALAAYLEQNGSPGLRLFWKKLRQGLEREDAELENLWRCGLAELDLRIQDLQVLEAYPRVLRSYDTEQVCRELLRMNAELEVRRREMRQRFRRDFKAQTGVQVSAALLLLILLL